MLSGWRHWYIASEAFVWLSSYKRWVEPISGRVNCYAIIFKFPKRTSANTATACDDTPHIDDDVDDADTNSDARQSDCAPS